LIFLVDLLENQYVLLDLIVDIVIN
jgi:hypothetical protein